MYKWLILLLAILIMIPSSAMAWDDKGNSSPVCKPYSLYHRWPHSVGYSMVGDYGIPPQLDSQQAFRWSMASPSGKVHLAELYGVPEDIAEDCGAYYIKHNPRGWQYNVTFGGK